MEPESRGNEKPFDNDLKGLEAEVALLKENIKQKNGDGKSSSNYKKEKPTRRCKWCENGTDRCDHCFKCGSTKHFARGCKQKKIPTTGKLSGTTLKGQSVVQGEALLCNHCMKKNPKKLCTGCRTAFYCSKNCQKKHWEYHKIICKSINLLENDSKHKESVNVNEIKGTVFGLNSKSKSKKSLIKIVGISVH